MSYRFLLCKEDQNFEKYTSFFIKHRKQMSPPCDMSDTLKTIQGHLSHGRVILGLNKKDEAIGFIGYYLGTPEQNYENKKSALVEVVLVQESYRQTLFFLRGFQYLLNHLLSLNPPVKEILFYAHTEFPYLTKLYSKFAHTTSQYQGSMGLLDVYKVPINEVTARLPQSTLKRRCYDL